jgi:hypothetical protein
MKKKFGAMLLCVGTLCAAGPFDSVMNLIGIGGGSWLETLSIRSDADLNYIKSDADPSDSGPNPVTLDVILIYDEKVLENLQKLSSEQYFQAKDQLLKDFKDKIQVYTQEVLPNTWKDGIKIEPRGNNVVAILSFARYHNAGDHRSKIQTGITSAEIHLKKDDFEIVDHTQDQNTEQK